MRVTDGFTGAFWYVTQGCPYALVQWSWDGTPQGTSALDQTSCSAKRPFTRPPTTELGAHAVRAVPCDVNPTDGSLFCDVESGVTVSYVIDATPTLVLTPAKGLATHAFSATYKTNSDGCGLNMAQFTWDGVALDPIPLDVGSCSVVVQFPSAPKPNAAGKSP